MNREQSELNCKKYNFKKEILYVTEKTDMRKFRNDFINAIVGDINDF